jgi:hypothetical protein
MHEFFVSLVIKYDAERLGIKPLFDEYLPLFETEKSVLDMVLKSGLTKDILALDVRRDELFRGFKNAVKSGLLHYDAAKVKAAQRIFFILKAYGDIVSRPLDDKTAAINDLCREFQEPKNAKMVATFGVGDWLNHLAEANSALSETMMSRYREMAQRPKANMRETRKSIDKIFRSMLDLVEAQAMVNGAELYRPFASELNAVMQRFELSIAQRQGRKAKIESSDE